MNYIDEIANRIFAETHDGKEMPEHGAPVYRAYALLARCKGRGTTLEDVHDAWAIGRMVTRPDHKDIVPFDELTPEIQEYDRKYMEAIHACSK